MKKVVIVLISLLVVVGIVNQYKINIEKQEQQQIEEYKQCILKQSKTRGWIIRSECAKNYQTLDKKANLEYQQNGYDLYLK